jgi:hypothetical protein
MTNADRNATGTVIQHIVDPVTGATIVTMRRLPGGLIACDVEGEDAIKLARQFLPKTQTGVLTTPDGKKKYRFVYRGGKS